MLSEREKEVFRNPYLGMFFAFEGIDFCGKSTQIVRANNYLMAKTSNRVDVVLTKEPTQGEYGLRIRQILADKDLFAKTSDFEFQRLFAKDSQEHCKNIIIPALKRSEIVLTDRFRHSACVYGAKKWCLDDMRMLMEMNKEYLGDFFVWPDCTFIFDLSPEIALCRGMERAKKTGQKLDEMEKVKTLSRVRSNFYLLANEYPECHIIDADRNEEDIFVDVRRFLEGTMRKKGWK